MEGSALNLGTVEQPRGVYSSRVDDKGRLKLPADFQRYFVQIGADKEKVFITTFDEQIGRIYPLPVWKQVEETFRGASGEDADTAEDLWFLANDLGGDAELDNQARLLLPAELRRALGVENQAVHLQSYKGHIRIYSQAVYAARKQRAREGREDKLKVFEKKGLL